ncbi:hypothetical protein WAI453_002757 [Rhynchosporium graminicola]|uniref:Related to component of actin cortical patches LAS17 n=1 Tax=Rhynchosporium graminicola TaxID=2792576 RepID=A0A1E1JV04_9HELO|nr:related to component of actin cortical patches LAS17 [Rhynchosporium commune]
MSRDPYRSSGPDLPYGGRGGGGGGGQRWDSERFAQERDRARFAGGPSGPAYGERDRFEERDSGFLRAPSGGRARERSVDEIYERRGPRGFEEDRYDSREYYDDGPRRAPERAFGRDRGHSITIEKERERERDFIDPDPPIRRGGNRPAFLRRQSSLDTFDRKPLARFGEREEYGPPARYRERDELRAPLPPPLTPIPLPRSRGLPPPRGFREREYEDIEIAEPDYYGDESFRGYPERVREREIIRRRRRSKESRARSKESRASHSVRGSVRSSSTSSSSSEETTISVRSEFPKKGKTRMPARLVHKKAIIELGYPFEEEGDTIIIQKALGRENIDEVIKLSEDFRNSETVKEKETTLTTYLIGPEAQISGARSEAGTVIEERHEVFTVPPPPPPQSNFTPTPPPAPPVQIVQDTKIVEHTGTPHHHHQDHHSQYHPDPVIINTGPGPREEIYERREVYESGPPVGSMALAVRPHDHRKDERSIRAEIKALEAEKEALRAEKRAERELRKADRIRGHGRTSESELILYDRDGYERTNEEVTLVRRERIVEPEGGVRIEKDKKGRMAISVPKYYT